MIAGIGTDLLEIERLARTLDRHGTRFLDHVFTSDEQAQAPSGAGRAAYFAARWAAKEAVAKALGTGIGAQCAWKDITIARAPSGRPVVRLANAAARTAAQQGIGTIHISLSHERSLACATAVAEQAPQSLNPPTRVNNDL